MANGKEKEKAFLLLRIQEAAPRFQEVFFDEEAEEDSEMVQPLRRRKLSRIGWPGLLIVMQLLLSIKQTKDDILVGRLDLLLVDLSLRRSSNQRRIK